MDFEQYAPARDLFYLAALFLGAGCGCILNRYRRKAGTRFRNLSITAGLCLFSGTAAALFAAAIYSNWSIFWETDLFLPVGILALIAALVFRFPRAAGFPVFLLSGVCVVFIGYTCLRFPLIDDSGRLRLSRDGSSRVHIEQIQPNENASQRKGGNASLSFQTAGEDSVLEINALRLVPSKAFPLFGGVSRGLIMEIRHNGANVYTNPQYAPNFLIDPNSGNSRFQEFMKSFFYPREIQERLEIRRLPPGTNLTVFFEDAGLLFR